MSRQLHHQVGGIDGREDPVEDLDVSLGLVTNTSQKRPSKSGAADMNKVIKRLVDDKLIDEVDLRLEKSGDTLQISVNEDMAPRVKETLSGCRQNVFVILERPADAPDVREFKPAKTQMRLFE